MAAATRWSSFAAIKATRATSWAVRIVWSESLLTGRLRCERLGGRVGLVGEEVDRRTFCLDAGVDQVAGPLGVRQGAVGELRPRSTSPEANRIEP